MALNLKKNNFKNLVTATAFLEWYFSERSDYERAGELMLDALMNGGSFSITAYELFKSCGYIPQYICEDVKDDCDYTIEYTPEEVAFIDNL
jgi:hypothetical protein